MAGRPRKPLAHAKLTGADKKNPQRYRGRNEPKVSEPLGDPPSWLRDTEEAKARTAWRELESEIPWLNRSHRSLIEIASVVKGKMMAGQVMRAADLALLRSCLQSIGATPADASKVGQGGAEEKDPDDKFFDD